MVFTGLQTPNMAVDFTDLYVSVHSSGLCCSHQTFELSTAEVLGLYGQFFDVYISREQLMPSHPCCVDVKDLESAFLIW